MLTVKQGSLAVVVSPLTSLMMDQRQRFAPTGFTVGFVGEAQKDNEICTNIFKWGCPTNVYQSREFVEHQKYWQTFQTSAYQEK